ncbi:MAG: hypothetical protein WAN16_01195 [Chthoniobacterales bacterium]
MKPLQILLTILLIGASATVVGVAGFRYGKSSAVPDSSPLRVEAAVAPGSGIKENGKTINLAAEVKAESGTKATHSGLSFMELILKAKAEGNSTKLMALWYEAVQSLAPSRIGQALADVDGIKDPGERIQLRNMLLSRWGGERSHAALAYLQGLGSSMENL